MFWPYGLEDYSSAPSVPALPGRDLSPLAETSPPDFHRPCQKAAAQ